MLLLGILGLVATAGGTILGMIGQGQVNKEQEAQARLQAQQLRDTQAIYGTQVANAKADIAAAGQMYGIQQQALAIQGVQLGRQAAGAQGSITAQAAVGNLGGESVLRRAVGVQRAYREQATLLEGQRTQARLGYEQTLRNENLTIQTAEMQSLHAGQNAQLAQDEADWLDQYGWMSVVGIGLKGIGAMAGQLTEPNNPFGIGASSPTPLPTPLPTHVPYPGDPRYLK
jgi:hypothetical protein